MAHTNGALPKTIGLTLSGGGYRAAAFHLGTLSYLERCGLLSRVEVVSTVSGGTFTGVAYILSLGDGEDFQHFYKSYYNRLQENALLEDLVSRIGDERPPPGVPSKRRDLITTAAELYSTRFFVHPKSKQPRTFGDILNSNTKHIHEAIFNSTDFRNGTACRFQKSEKGRIGNYYWKIDSDSASLIRLGDIVAASSCFPGGFEPLVFPDDFSWPESKVPVAITECLAGKQIPLMDGGVYDNQGLESLLIAVDRMGQQKKIDLKSEAAVDLIISSDVDRRSDNLYPLPGTVADHIPWWARWFFCWNPNFGQLSLLLGFIQLASCIVIAGIVYGLFQAWKSGSWTLFSALGVLMSLPLIVSLIIFFLGFALRNKLTTIVSTIPLLGRDSWQGLKRIRLTQALDMIITRGSSLLALSSSVFMKRIRAKGYRTLYNDPRYLDKIISNFVYQMEGVSPIAGGAGQWFFENPYDAQDSQTDSRFSEKKRLYIKSVDRPSALMSPLIEKTAIYPTTLWFMAPTDLDMLIAVGQFTTCFNLMKYVARVMPFDEEAGLFLGEGGELWTKLVNDWEKFRANPFFLIDKK